MSLGPVMRMIVGMTTVKRAPWMALAIASMWVAVLFVGLFGGDIVNSDAGGNFSKVPVVVVVALAALIGTWLVAKWGFGRGTDDERLSALESRVTALETARAAEHVDTAERERVGA
jgi:hypothetical protein